MGILPYKVSCNAALCVFHVSLLKVALSKVLDPNIEMNRKSRPVDGQQELFYSFLETIHVFIRLNSRYCFPVFNFL